MLLFIEDELSKIADSGRFNTSHVTLYRYIRGIIIVILWFQYISCYSLSIPEDVQDKIKKLFQYISCYSLSQQTTIRTMQASVSIHLMLLFISRQYQEAQYLLDVSIHLMLLFIQFLASYDELEISFNTSHVTLYLERASDFVDTMTLFQYISCYSLSKEGIDNMKDVRSFNTSHVTLYPLVL